ncbi:hypothetical protein [Paenibacillus kandeliae]|uniref:hypothetical protein n=1 Tax=Paenibacillus kandeliae TaxID=3231269 RepID=UPI00345AFE8B
MADVKLQELPPDAKLADVIRITNLNTQQLQHLLINLDSKNIKSLDASKINQ